MLGWLRAERWWGVGLGRGSGVRGCCVGRGSAEGVLRGDGGIIGGWRDVRVGSGIWIRAEERPRERGLVTAKGELLTDGGLGLAGGELFSLDGCCVGVDELCLDFGLGLVVGCGDRGVVWGDLEWRVRLGRGWAVEALERGEQSRDFGDAGATIVAPFPCVTTCTASVHFTLAEVAPCVGTGLHRSMLGTANGSRYSILKILQRPLI